MRPDASQKTNKNGMPPVRVAAAGPPPPPLPLPRPHRRARARAYICILQHYNNKI
jgi:hypothetical protein